MDDSILSSPVLRDHKSGDMWSTPVRATVRAMKRDGKGYGAIFAKTSVPKSTVRRICKSESLRTTRKEKVFKPKLLKEADIKRIYRFVSKSWTNRCKPWGRVKAELNLKASITTIRKTMKRHGYRRCVACRRPFISEKQAKRRLVFALKYRLVGNCRLEERGLER
jgi:hypothetical protein